jgi:HEAT repeat protein
MKQSFPSTAALLSLVLLGGCHGLHSGNNVPGAPKSPPPFPKEKNVPVNQALLRSAMNEVAEALNSPDEILRAHALETLKNVRLPDTDRRVLLALSDPSPLVRKAAAFAAGELHIAAAADRLTPLVNAPVQPDSQDQIYVEQVRIAAIFALFRLGDATHAHELEQTALDPRPPVRADTAFVLGMLGQPSAKPGALAILSEMLRHDSDGNVRLQAAEAMWKLGDEKGEDALIAATVSNYASDQAVALLALAEPHDQRVLGNIEGFLATDYPEVSLVAARAAGMLGSQDGYGVAMNGADSKDPRQRALAALAFGAIGRRDAQPILDDLVSDSNPDVRLAAADAIGQIDKSK